MTDHVAEAVLVYLRRKQEPASIVDVAEALDIGRGEVRAAIVRLWRAGLVVGSGGLRWSAV